MTVPYANAQYETFATDAVYGVTKIRYKLSNVGCSCQQLQVEYQEQASSFHTCDWTPILTSTNTAQLVSTTTDADGVVNQIYELSWNTLGLHNADYQLRLKADYNCNCHQTAFRSFEQTHTVNVKNLDITTCNPNGNVDYLRWDPDQNLADTTIRSTLEDNGTTDTTLSINIYHSDRIASPNPVRTVTATTSSNSVYPYTWDGKDGSEATCPPGIYLFTVNATHNQTGGGDSVSDRAADAFIVEDRLVDVAGQEYMMDFQAKVQGTVANSYVIRFDPLLSILGCNTGASPLNSSYPYVTSNWLQVARIDTSENLEVLLFTGRDGTPENDKSHRSRNVFGRNFPVPYFGTLGVIGDELPGESPGFIAAISLKIRLLYATITHNSKAKFSSAGGDTYRKIQPAKRPDVTVNSSQHTCNINAPWYLQTQAETSIHKTQVVSSLRVPNNRILIYAGHSGSDLVSLYCRFGTGCKPCRITLPDIMIMPKDGNALAILITCYGGTRLPTVTIASEFVRHGWNVIGYPQLLYSDTACGYIDALVGTMPVKPGINMHVIEFTANALRLWVVTANWDYWHSTPLSHDRLHGINPRAVRTKFRFIPAE